MKKLLLFSSIFIYLNASNIEMNFFGFTFHFKAARNKYPLQIKNKKYVLNPGIGINYYLKNNYFLTINYLKNCPDKATYITGINKKFYLNKDFSFIFGLNYIRTTYSKTYNKIIPLYSIRYNFIKKWSLNITYVPKSFSVNKKSEFLFFYFSYKL